MYRHDRVSALTANPLAPLIVSSGARAVLSDHEFFRSTIGGTRNDCTSLSSIQFASGPPQLRKVKKATQLLRGETEGLLRVFTNFSC